MNQLTLYQDTVKEDQLLTLRADLARIWILLINGNILEADKASENFLFKAKTVDYKSILAYSLYFKGNVAFQIGSDKQSCAYLLDSTYLEKEHNYRVYVDNYAGLCLCQSLHGETSQAMSSWQVLSNKVNLFGYNWFKDHVNSIRYRLLWHMNEAQEHLSWALKDWSTPNHTELMFALDFPGFTKIKLVCTYGNKHQITQSLKFLDKIEEVLNATNNNYHRLDILLIRAMAYFQLKKNEQAGMFLSKAIEYGTAVRVARPFIEIGLVFPGLRETLLSSSISSILPNNVWLNATNQVVLDHKNIQPDPNQQLSLREKELVKLVKLGLRNKEIADQLNISEVTVKSHLTNIFRKLGVRNRSRLIHLLSSYDLSN